MCIIYENHNDKCVYCTPLLGAGRQLAGLTGIRFFAALMVLLVHFGAGFADKSGLPSFIVNPLHNGFLGVSLFFILSGFIIAWQYDWRVENRSQLYAYGLSRFARVYPLYLLALVVTLPFAWPALTPRSTVAVLTLTQAWSPPASIFGFSWLGQAWTLSVELFFYLCAPLLLRTIRNFSVRALAIQAGAIAALIAILAEPVIQPGYQGFAQSWLRAVPIPVFRLLEFAYGATLCLLFQRSEGFIALVARPTLLALSLGAIAAILMATREPHALAIAVILFGIVFVQIAGAQGRLTRFLDTPTMRLLGGSSYALYILQGPVREYCRALLPAGIDRILNAPLAILISILVFKLYEEPARRFIRTRFG